EAKKAWYADLRSETALHIANLKFRDYAADSVEGSLRSVDDLLTFEHLFVKRNENEFSANGEYHLPAAFRDAAQQPAKVDVSLNAIELGNYWTTNSPDKVTGPLQINGQVQWNNG